MMNTEFRAHDHNEYLNAETFLQGIQVYTKIISNLANVWFHLSLLKILNKINITIYFQRFIFDSNVFDLPNIRFKLSRYDMRCYIYNLSSIIFRDKMFRDKMFRALSYLTCYRNVRRSLYLVKHCHTMLFYHTMNIIRPCTRVAYIILIHTFVYQCMKHFLLHE